MATQRMAHTNWEGSLTEGRGFVEMDSSGAGSFPVTWAARTEQPGNKTSPEELIAAAHSSCFSMALSNGLTQSGKPPTRLTTQAEVSFEPGTGITGIVLSVEGQVPGIDEDAFLDAAEQAKANCPVSQALAGTTISLNARLT